MAIRIEFVCSVCGAVRFFNKPRKRVRCLRCGNTFDVKNFDMLEIFQEALGEVLSKGTTFRDLRR